MPRQFPRGMGPCTILCAASRVRHTFSRPRAPSKARPTGSTYTVDATATRYGACLDQRRRARRSSMRGQPTPEPARYRTAGSLTSGSREAKAPRYRGRIAELTYIDTILGPQRRDGEPDTAATEEEALDAYSRVVSSVAERVAPSVSNLRVSRRMRGRFVDGGGSGFVITPDGFMLTSAHVAE